MEEVVRRLLAVQAQDPRAVPLAVRARCSSASAGDLERALGDDRSLVVSWLGRGTLHLVGREDYGWMWGLCSPTRLTNSRRRLAQEGVSAGQAERAVELVAAALAEHGPLSRPRLAELLAAERIPTAGQATAHLLMLAALRGVAVVVPPRDRQGGPTLALTADWLGARPSALGPRERTAALAELARRYLAGHAPASAADLATWAGLPLRDARRGLEEVSGELEQLEDGLVDLAGRPHTDGRLPARLLPAYDPYTLGWRERAFAVASEHGRRVHPGGGVVRAVVIEDGWMVGTWGARRQDGRLRVTVEAFERLTDGLVDELEAEAAAIARFEGLVPGAPVLVVRQPGGA